MLPILLGARMAIFARAKMLAGAIKPIKYFIDSTFRARVEPVPGSVLYCDLMLAVEHSGIYLGQAVYYILFVACVLSAVLMIVDLRRTKRQLEEQDRREQEKNNA